MEGIQWIWTWLCRPVGIITGFLNEFIMNTIHTKSVQIVLIKLSDLSQSKHTQVANRHQDKKQNIPILQIPFLSPPRHSFTVLSKWSHCLPSNFTDYFKLYRHINPTGWFLLRFGSVLHLWDSFLWMLIAVSWLLVVEIALYCMNAWCWERLRQKEKRATKDKTVGWHHQLSGREPERTPRGGEGLRAAVHGVTESDATEQQ